MTDIPKQPAHVSLIGHYCPMGRYPAHVIPIVETEEGKLAVFLDDDKAVFETVPDDLQFVSHDSKTQSLLSGFRVDASRLFGISATNVISYQTAQTAEFVSRILSDEEFAADNPFLRLSLAKQGGDLTAIRRELSSCVRRLSAQSVDVARQWYEGQRLQLKELWISASAAIPDNFEHFVRDGSGTTGEVGTRISRVWFPSPADPPIGSRRRDLAPTRLHMAIFPLAGLPDQRISNESSSQSPTLYLLPDSTSWPARINIPFSLSEAEIVRKSIGTHDRKMSIALDQLEQFANRIADSFAQMPRSDLLPIASFREWASSTLLAIVISDNDAVWGDMHGARGDEVLSLLSGMIHGVQLCSPRFGVAMAVDERAEFDYRLSWKCFVDDEWKDSLLLAKRERDTVLRLRARSRDRGFADNNAILVNCENVVEHLRGGMLSVLVSIPAEHSVRKYRTGSDGNHVIYDALNAIYGSSGTQEHFGQIQVQKVQQFAHVLWTGIRRVLGL